MGRFSISVQKPCVFQLKVMRPSVSPARDEHRCHDLRSLHTKVDRRQSPRNPGSTTGPYTRPSEPLQPRAVWGTMFLMGRAGPHLVPIHLRILKINWSFAALRYLPSEAIWDLLGIPGDRRGPCGGVSLTTQHTTPNPSKPSLTKRGFLNRLKSPQFLYEKKT